MPDLKRRTFLSCLAALPAGAWARPAPDALSTLLLAQDAPAGVGALVTYTYRGTTAAGAPRLASYQRLREV